MTQGFTQRSASLDDGWGMRFTARALVAAALTVLVLAGCEDAAKPASADADSAVSETTSAPAATAEPTESAVTEPALTKVAETAPAPVAPAPSEVAPAPAPVAPAPVAPAPVAAPAETDPRFDTCKDAKAAGYGPYVQGVDPEYDWYRDSDHDGTNCEK